MTTYKRTLTLPASLTVARGTTVLRGEQGPTGPAGPPGPTGGSALLRPASGAISGHRVVKLQADGTVAVADNTDALSRTLPLGVTTGAAADGATATVIMSGTLIEPSWSWAPGPLFLGAAGALVQVAPVFPAFVRDFGVAISATEIWIDPQPSIITAP